MSPYGITFYDWLMRTHLGTDTPEGNLANDIARDPLFPREGNVHQVFDRCCVQYRFAPKERKK